MSTRADRTFDTKTLRQTFGSFATGVTVVTVGGPVPHGMTANSFTAVSLEPALLLVCVERGAIMHDALATAGRFAVSVLGAGHGSLARYFADRDRPVGAEQFAAVDWYPGEHSGAPLIAGALAHFECTVWRSYDGGDHTIFLGKLLALRRGVDNEPLLFHLGSLQKIGVAV